VGEERCPLTGLRRRSCSYTSHLQVPRRNYTVRFSGLKFLSATRLDVDICILLWVPNETSALRLGILRQISRVAG
jgi:hypothetical protein